jgi:hypothetical protein
MKQRAFDLLINVVTYLTTFRKASNVEVSLFTHCILTVEIILTNVLVNNRHKALITEDSRIGSANKKLKGAMASFDRAKQRVFDAEKHAAAGPDSEKLWGDLERAAKAHGNARNAYTKALDASMDTIGTGSGRVMVLLPSHVATRK